MNFETKIVWFLKKSLDGILRLVIFCDDIILWVCPIVVYLDTSSVNFSPI